MRLYRSSPLHPALGAHLARLLGLVTAQLPSPQIRLVDGIRWELDLREVIDASLFFSGSFEPRAESVMARHLGPGMTSIDVGANVGYHALRMARQVGLSGRVVAIEPAPGAVARLRRNLALNDLTNVAIVVAALGDHDVQSVELQVQSSYPLSGRGGPERVLTRVARLDSLVLERQLERVDFIKIDVDGQEARVLRGARGTLRRFRPPVLFELDTHGGRGRRGVDRGALRRAYRAGLYHLGRGRLSLVRPRPAGEASATGRGMQSPRFAVAAAPPRP